MNIKKHNLKLFRFSSFVVTILNFLIRREINIPIYPFKYDKFQS